MKLVTKKIGETDIKIGDGNYSSKYPKASDFLSEGVPFISATDIVDGRIRKDNFRFIAPSQHQILTKGHLKDGDVLIVTRGNGVGLVGYVDSEFENCNINAQLVLFRANEKVLNNKFLFYFLSQKSVYEQIRGYASGSAQPQLPIKTLVEIPISYPPLPTQQKIASILSAYDDGIENNLKRIRLLEEAAQQLYREWFVRFRFPGWKEVKVVEGLPEGWERIEIHSICDLLGGFPFKSNEYSGSGLYKIVTIKNVGDRFFDNSKFDRLESIPEKMKGHCNIQEGDILLSLTGNVGRTCLAFGENLLLNQRVSIISPKTNELKSFLYYLFGSEELIRVMNNLSSGVAQQNLSPVKLGFHQINLPSQRTLNEFSKITTPMLNQILVLNKQNHHLKEARDLLLPRLMSGALEV